MAMRNPLGSLSALSLSANTTTIPMLVAAGVAVTVSAAVFTYKAYKNYEEKKHRKEIEDINRLHERYLSRIVIYDYSEIKGFPPIFKLTIDGDTSTVDSLHYTDDEIDNIGKTLPHGTDISLSMYRESVVNAILKLKEYYFSRKDHHDTTSGVLSYLLNMLQTKCLNFEGYDYDIAYLHAISNFVNAYASSMGRENSQHFSRLNPVYSYLLTAKQALEKHKEKMSLEETIGELRDACIHQNNQLIRSFAKLVNKNDAWELIKTVTHDEISQGLIRREYVHNEIKGLVFNKDSKIDIPRSVFRHWLIALSNYFLETLDTDANANPKNLTSPDQLFAVPDFHRLVYLRNNKRTLSRQEDTELAKLEKTVRKIQKVFELSQNFITTELDLNTKNKITHFVTVTDTEKLLERSKIMALFATTIHQVISLQYLCTHLLKSIKQLGEIYIKNPKNFHWVFMVLDQLSKKILDNIDETRKALTKLQLASLNNMQLLEKELFPEEVKAILDSTTAAVSRLNMKILAYRHKKNDAPDPAEPTVQSVKHEMFELATSLADIYCMNHRTSDRTSVSETHEDNTPKPVTTTEATITPTPTLNSISKTMAAIYETISAIKRTESPGEGSALRRQFQNECRTYQLLFQRLSHLEAKTASLQNEANKSNTRIIKAEKLLRLTADISRNTLEFLQLPRAKRIQATVPFCDQLHTELNDATHSFIDEHKSPFMRTAYSICHLSIFYTDTRRKFNRFNQACNSLMKIYA